MNRLVVLCRTYGGIAFRAIVAVSAAVLDPSTGIAAAIRAAMVACTSGRSVGASVTVTNTDVMSTGTLSHTAYGTSRDKMVMLFRDGDGGSHSLMLPGPKGAVVSAVTMDTGVLTAGPLKVLTDLLTANYCSRGGGALGPVISAIRRRHEAKG